MDPTTDPTHAAGEPPTAILLSILRQRLEAEPVADKAILDFAAWVCSRAGFPPTTETIDDRHREIGMLFGVAAPTPVADDRLRMERASTGGDPPFAAALDLLAADLDRQYGGRLIVGLNVLLAGAVRAGFRVGNDAGAEVIRELTRDRDHLQELVTTHEEHNADMLRAWLDSGRSEPPTPDDLREMMLRLRRITTAARKSAQQHGVPPHEDSALIVELLLQKLEVHVPLINELQAMQDVWNRSRCPDGSPIPKGEEFTVDNLRLALGNLVAWERFGRAMGKATDVPFNPLNIGAMEETIERWRKAAAGESEFIRELQRQHDAALADSTRAGQDAATHAAIGAARECMPDGFALRLESKAWMWMNSGIGRYQTTPAEAVRDAWRTVIEAERRTAAEDAAIRTANEAMPTGALLEREGKQFRWRQGTSFGPCNLTPGGATRGAWESAGRPYITALELLGWPKGQDPIRWARVHRPASPSSAQINPEARIMLTVSGGNVTINASDIASASGDSDAEEMREALFLLGWNGSTDLKKWVTRYAPRPEDTKALRVLGWNGESDPVAWANDWLARYELFRKKHENPAVTPRLTDPADEPNLPG